MKTKPLCITISDEADVQKQIESLDLKPLASLQEICTRILSDAREMGVAEVRIAISPMLLADSYVDVPAMFARSMRKCTEFPSLQSTSILGDLVVIAAESRRPTTFRARALMGVLKHRIFKSHKKEVPKSYRRRPGILSRILSTETGYIVQNETRDKEIVWKAKEEK